jgi:hypothetical protein
MAEADLHQLDADLADGEVVAVALAAVDDDLVLHAGRVGQAGHARRVFAGDARGRRQRQTGGGAAADKGGVVVGQLGDAPADGALQLVQVDEAAGGVTHRVQHFGRHERAAETGQRRRAVDHPAQSQVLVDAGR